MLEHLKRTDPDIYNIITAEMNRQETVIGLIASENVVSRSVLDAMGSVLTNKYAEGYPGRRYYGGCEFVDEAERIARKRAKELFHVDHVNVQPHSGTQANLAAIFAAIEPGATILSMDLNHGGHLSHGHRLNAIGKLFKIVNYGVERETEVMDYDKIQQIANDCKPAMIICGASAYPRTIDFARFATIAKSAGAVLLADIAHIAGLVATGRHPSPAPHADFVTTTTHKTLRGPRGGMVMCREDWKKKLDSATFPGQQGGPLMHMIAAKAVCFGEALQPSFKDYTGQVVANAKTLAKELAAKGYRIVSGGTDNHLMLVDLTPKGLTGAEAEERLGQNGIVVNKNLIPFDQQPPMKASGIRIGTPIITSRGMKENETRLVAELIDATLAHSPDAPAQAAVRDKVKQLCKQFPIFRD